MAAITTLAAGLWSATGTWTGGVVPGNGDTITLNHAVTLDDTRIIGTSPAAGSGTFAVLYGTGSLSIAATGNLTCRGDIKIVGADLTIAAGGVLEFDAHLAGTPATARYVCQIGTFPSDTNARLKINGTSGAHSIVRSNSGGANGRFTNNGNDHSGAVDATYCDFLRIGDATNVAFDPLCSGETFSFVNCTFTACADVGSKTVSGASATAVVRIDHCTFSGGVGAWDFAIPVTANSGGVRQFTFNYCELPVYFGQITQWTIEDSVFVYYEFIGTGTWTSFARNLIAAAVGVNDLAVAGVATDCYWSTGGVNRHGFTTIDQTSRITGSVFEAPDGADGAGDCVTFNNPSGPTTVTVDHCLVLDDGAGNNTGTMLSCLGGANASFVAHHNTYHGGQGVYVGETYAGRASMGQVRNCLAWAVVAGTAFIIKGEVGVAQNVVQGADAHHNGVWNPQPTNGYGGGLSFSPATQGAGDVSGDPQFVDRARGIKKWSTSLGGAGTTADAMARLKAGTATVSQLLTYVKAGFAPQNAAYHTASDNVAPSNGWIGAVAGATAASGGAPRRHRRRH